MNTESQKNVKQGAAIGGWVCLILGIALMKHSLLWFWVYGPLFLAAFVLGIAALAQKRILSGILLLLSAIATPIIFLLIFSKRTDEYFKNHPNEAYEDGKRLGKVIAAKIEDKPEALVEESPVPVTNPSPIEQVEPAPPSPPITSPSSTLPTPTIEQVEPASPSPQAEVTQPAVEARKGIRITSATVPIVYELKAPVPTQRESIAQSVTDGSFARMDEFTRREYLQKLNKLIDEKTIALRSDNVFFITVQIFLEEYDFEKFGFPISKAIPNERLERKYIPLIGPKGKDYGYELSFTNDNQLRFFPLPLEDARKLSAALRASRKANITIEGTLERCESIEVHLGMFPTSKVVFLKAEVLQLDLDNDENIFSWIVPETSPVPRAKILPNRIRDTEPTATPTSEKEFLITGIPPGDVLNVRASPAMNAVSVFTLANGDKVEISGKPAINGKTEWLPISFNSQSGWVRSKYVRPATE